MDLAITIILSIVMIIFLAMVFLDGIKDLRNKD